MLLLMIDALLFGSVLLAAALVVRSVFRKNKERKLEQALVRQQAAANLAQQVETLDPEKLKEDEKKVEDKLNSLH